VIKNIRANSFAFVIWTLVSCALHMVLFRARVNLNHQIPQRIMMAIAAIVTILFVHELIHFVFMKMFYKGKVRFVFTKDRLGLPMPGVSAEGRARKWQEVMMLIAPFFFLTLLPDILFAFCAEIELFFFIVAIGNCAGCFYDIMDVCIAWKKTPSR